MAIARPAGSGAAGEDIQIRKIGLHDLRVALSQGWGDFLDKRGDLVFIGLIYPGAVILAGIYAYRQAILPLLFPLVAGAVLLGPAVASGFYELARRRELGLDARWRHFLDVFHGRTALSVISLASVVTLLFVLWMVAAWYIYAMTLGAAQPDATGSAAGFLEAVFTTPAGWRMIVIGNLVGLGFAIVTLAISVVSFPMLVDQPADWGTAMRTSVRVARRNPVTIAVWGLIVVALLVLGALPALVGLAVVLPVLGYATWHLYTRAVVR
ncbi:hypothetical protein GCM10011494_34600 [Novosphingobium endophyticum]|uniref:DUF2189 domain-containing protein n=1 Tax=Novosphingobium endophyticum TaxID=1955250 RepID=A0A916X622_9SPHN|nr:DUF2189 domain-containing protein [Novosphingobium endophyticum]GGC12851.1 hypothetical protein GCM10011494_34600 [Novosphingobium endophyticum]